MRIKISIKKLNIININDRIPGNAKKYTNFNKK